MKDKADRIEEALCRLPLEKRGNVISSKEGNPVKTALASRRKISCLNPNIDTVETNTFFAAQSFKDLKKVFNENVNKKEEDASSFQPTPTGGRDEE